MASVWEFVRNEAFNAHNYFDQPGTPVSGYHKHDFGYSVGGPIWKNHTFFFWLQNWRREVRSLQLLQLRSLGREPGGRLQRPMRAHQPESNRLPHRPKYGEPIP